MKKYDYRYKKICLRLDRPEVKTFLQRAEALDTTPSRYLYKLLREDLARLEGEELPKGRRAQ